MKRVQLFASICTGIVLLFPAVAPAATTDDVTMQLQSLFQQLVTILEQELQILLTHQNQSIPFALTVPVPFDTAIHSIATTTTNSILSTGSPLLTVFPAVSDGHSLVLSGTTNQNAPITVQVNGSSYVAQIFPGFWLVNVAQILPNGSYVVTVSVGNGVVAATSATGTVTVTTTSTIQ